MEELMAGTRIDHDKYGEGIVSKVNLTNYEIFFARGGKMDLSKMNRDYKILEKPDSSTPSSSTGFSLAQVEEAITFILDKYGALSEIVEMGAKWTGGMMILQPENQDLKPKEVPIEVFFHKIVMLRDRLRVLEQNINSHPVLTDEDKVNLQQYITRIYGSLTTFNILFANREDYFKGASS